MPRNKLTPEQRVDMHAAIRAGDRYKDIADRFGINENTVSHHARNLGFHRHGGKRSVLAQVVPERIVDLLTQTRPGRTVEWMEAGACRTNSDPDVMYPEYERQSGNAKKICAGCPVKQTCLEWALATREEFGVWGGLTGRERRALVGAA